MNPDNVNRLTSFARVTSGGDRDEPYSGEQLIQAMDGATAILSLNGTGAPEITTEVLCAVGTVKIAVISHWWHGTHDQAKTMWEAAGVEVIEGATGNTDAVAEWTIACAIMGVRRLVDYDRDLKVGGKWQEQVPAASLLCESVVGLIGLGRIGQHVAQLFRRLGATVIAYDAYVSPDIAERIGVRSASLQEVIQSADVLSVHLPVTDQTMGMIGTRELSWIRDGTVVINSARAAIFDDDAFMAEVKTKRFSVCLDVFPAEPLAPDHPLRSLGNAFITPHIAGNNPKMFVRCGRQAIDTLQLHLRDK